MVVRQWNNELEGRQGMMSIGLTRGRGIKTRFSDMARAWSRSSSGDRCMDYVVQLDEKMR
jgi:hypothetical protein